jgi:hypothetical protein
LVYFTAIKVEQAPLNCTTCCCQLFLGKPKNIEIHPALGVLQCKVSYIFSLFGERILLFKKSSYVHRTAGNFTITDPLLKMKTDKTNIVVGVPKVVRSSAATNAQMFFARYRFHRRFYSRLTSIIKYYLFTHQACLRRCLGRVSFLEVTSHACKWSCLVCNNIPLWSQRALCRMVMSSIEYAHFYSNPLLLTPHK